MIEGKSKKVEMSGSQFPNLHPMVYKNLNPMAVIRESKNLYNVNIKRGIVFWRL